MIHEDTFYIFSRQHLNPAGKDLYPIATCNIRCPVKRESLSVILNDPFRHLTSGSRRHE